MTDPNPQDLPDGVDDADADEDALEQKQGVLDRFRGTGVGVEDPNIVGEGGPTDVPPGPDPDPSPPGV